MGALLAVVAATLLISAACSLLEATLYSTRVGTLEAARDQGRHVASATSFLRLKRNIGVPTSAILILNTIANTAGASLAGMLAARELGAWFVPAFSAVLTLAILLFSEILPKTFGAVHWKVLWTTVIWPLLFLERALWPLIWLTQAFSRLFIRHTGGPTTTEGEIIAMIRMGAHAGELSETELRMLTAVFRFDDAQARDAMFSRRGAVFFDVSWNLERCLEVAVATEHTRYPLCDGSMDNLVGLVHVKDLLRHIGKKSVDLKAIARPLRRVPETMPARSLLHEMQTTGPHMVAVIDEHGTTVGLATLETLLEQIIGPVEDEFDQELPEFEADGDGRFRVRGAISMRRLGVELDLDLSDSEASTLSGHVVACLGRFPTVGDTCQLDSMSVEVQQVEKGRATQLLIRTTHEPSAHDASGKSGSSR